MARRNVSSSRATLLAPPPGRIPQLISESPNCASSAANAWASVSRKYSLRSIPADHADPSPLSTRTPASTRYSSSSSTRIICRLSLGLMQFRFSGRLNLTHAMPSPTVNATVSVSSRSVLICLLRLKKKANRSDGKLARSRLHGNPAKLGELIDARRAPESSVARCAYATKGHLRLIVHRRAVDMAHAGADLTRHAQPPSGIAGEHRGRETVFAVIRQTNGFPLILGADDGYDRSEALLPVQAHRGHHAIYHGRRHDHTLGLASCEHPGSAGHGVVDETVDVIDRPAIDHGTERSVALSGVARRHGARLFREAASELLRDGGHRDDPLSRHADLPLIHESAEGRRLDRFIEICVLQNDERRLAAELEQARFEVLRAAFGDDAPDRGGSREVDPAHGRMIDESADHLARVPGIVRDQVDDAFRKASLGERLDDELMGPWTQLGGFEDYRVAAGERSCNGANAQNDGGVPRCDAEDNAYGLANRHCQTTGLVGRNDLAADLRGEGRRFPRHTGGKHQ